VQTRWLNGRTRYVLLETVRHYALEHTDPALLEQARRRHAVHFVAFARRADEGLTGAEQAAWLDRLEVDHDNLRAALAWASGENGDPAIAIGLVGALMWFWRVHSHYNEGRRWAAIALALSTLDGSALDQIKALIGDGLLAYHQSHFDDAWRTLEAALELADRTGDNHARGWALHGLGRVAMDIHRADARTYFERSIDCFQLVGDDRGAAYSMYFAAYTDLRQGRTEQVEERFALAYEVLVDHGDAWGLASLVLQWSLLAIGTRDWVLTAQRHLQSLDYIDRLHSPFMVSRILASLARATSAAGRHESAVRLLRAVEEVVSPLDTPAGPALPGTRFNAVFNDATAAVGQAAVEAAWEAGAIRTVDQAISLARQAAQDLMLASSA
jgi:non-specific serine/threonine protein kinase